MSTLYWREFQTFFINVQNCCKPARSLVIWGVSMSIGGGGGWDDCWVVATKSSRSRRFTSFTADFSSSELSSDDSSSEDSSSEDSSSDDSASDDSFSEEDSLSPSSESV